MRRQARRKALGGWKPGARAAPDRSNSRETPATLLRPFSLISRERSPGRLRTFPELSEVLSPARSGTGAWYQQLLSL